MTAADPAALSSTHEREGGRCWLAKNTDLYNYDGGGRVRAGLTSTTN